VAGNVINPFIKNMADDLDKRLNLFGNIFADISFHLLRVLTYRFNFANNYRTTSDYYFRLMAAVSRVRVQRLRV
jgi:hypothetical protein